VSCLHLDDEHNNGMSSLLLDTGQLSSSAKVNQMLKDDRYVSSPMYRRVADCEATR
jgi:hypothetical protein